MEKTYEINEVGEICRRMRINIIRMIEKAGSGHPGGSLSCVEILATLFFSILRRDRGDIFILSKGHASAALYSLMVETGDLREEELKTFRQFGSRLQGHPSSLWLPGVEFSSGMLGQGLSFANGRALRAKIEENPRLQFVLLGEGDLQYGQTWQAIQTAAQHQLGNVIAVVDCNEYQIGGRVKEIKRLEPLGEKLESFGWLAYGVDGHNINQLRKAFQTAIQASQERRLPSMIIAKTIKGKGVSFMEGDNRFHGTAPTKEQALKALVELGGTPWPNEKA